jgi:hypothetical protein
MARDGFRHRRADRVQRAGEKNGLRTFHLKPRPVRAACSR